MDKKNQNSSVQKRPLSRNFLFEISATNLKNVSLSYWRFPKTLEKWSGVKTLFVKGPWVLVFDGLLSLSFVGCFFVFKIKFLIFEIDFNLATSFKLSKQDFFR